MRDKKYGRSGRRFKLKGFIDCAMEDDE